MSFKIKNVYDLIEVSHGVYIAAQHIVSFKVVNIQYDQQEPEIYIHVDLSNKNVITIDCTPDDIDDKLNEFITAYGKAKR